LLIACVFIHFCRDVLQVFGFDFWLTEIGHEFGLHVSNIILSSINLTYSKWSELPLIIMELILIRKMIKHRKEIIKIFGYYEKMWQCFFIDYFYLFETLYLIPLEDYQKSLHLPTTHQKYLL
jgi:hypothetical protein